MLAFYYFYVLVFFSSHIFYTLLCCIIPFQAIWKAPKMELRTLIYHLFPNIKKNHLFPISCFSDLICLFSVTLFLHFGFGCIRLLVDHTLVEFFVTYSLFLFFSSS